MTVASTTNRKSFSGDGVTTSFGTSPVVFYESTDLVVEVYSSAGVATTLVEGTQYTVSGGSTTGATGTVNLAGGTNPYGAPAVGTTLLIRRVLPLVQEADFVNNDINDAEVSETALDKLTMIAQQISETSGRGVNIPAVETATDALTVLPFDRASKYLAFDASKNMIASDGPAGDNVPVSTFMATVLDDTSAADARTTLGAVGLTGNENVAGVKTFTSKPVLPATVPTGNEAASAAYVVAASKSLIHGLTYANNGTDATNDIDIATGGAMSDDGTYFMTLGSAITKRIDAAWAVGTGNGGLMSAAALTNQVYGIWLIARSDTGVVDVGFDASLTAPTMPTDYDKKRLIGWIQRVGGALRTVTVVELDGGGIRMQHTTPTLEVDSTALTTSRLLSALPSAPLGIKAKVSIRISLGDAGGAVVIVQSPDEADAAPSGSAAPGYTANIAAGVGIGATVDVLTNTSGQIAARASAAVDNYRVVPFAYEWGRR